MCNKEFDVSFLIPLEGSFLCCHLFAQKWSVAPHSTQIKNQSPSVSLWGPTRIWSHDVLPASQFALTPSLIALSSPLCLLHLRLCMCCFICLEHFSPRYPHDSLTSFGLYLNAIFSMRLAQLWFWFPWLFLYFSIFPGLKDILSTKEYNYHVS